MPHGTCRRAFNNAVEAAGGRDNLTERDFQMIQFGVYAGLGAASDLLAESLRERVD
jgi:hypothetical protein